MKYSIKADPSAWPTASASRKVSMTYNECVDCLGEVEIHFSKDGNDRTYKNDFSNIPLFLSELDDFLRRLSEQDVQPWYFGFAPFAHGIFRDGSMLISTMPGKSFSKGVYDLTEKEDLERLRSRIAKDISKFGKVQMDASQAGKVVQEF
jgi:hypothetical protein